MYFSLIGTADGLQWCVLARKVLVSTKAHPMPFLQLSYIHWQEQYLSRCSCNWTDHWDLEAIFSEKRMTNPEKWSSIAENITAMVSSYSLFPPLREMNENHITQILFSCFFSKQDTAWENGQISRLWQVLERSIYDIHGNIKIRRKLKKWREIWKERSEKVEWKRVWRDRGD